jgi:hypothetical protein
VGAGAVAHAVEQIFPNFSDQDRGKILEVAMVVLAIEKAQGEEACAMYLSFMQHIAGASTPEGLREVLREARDHFVQIQEAPTQETVLACSLFAGVVNERMDGTRERLGIGGDLQAQGLHNLPSFIPEWPDDGDEVLRLASEHVA